MSVLSATKRQSSREAEPDTSEILARPARLQEQIARCEAEQSEVRARRWVLEQWGSPRGVVATSAGPAPSELVLRKLRLEEPGLARRTEELMIELIELRGQLATAQAASDRVVQAEHEARLRDLLPRLSEMLKSAEALAAEIVGLETAMEARLGPVGLVRWPESAAPAALRDQGQVAAWREQMRRAGLL